MRSARLLPSFRFPILALVVGLVVFTLSACGGSPSTGGEATGPALPSPTLGQEPEPTGVQAPAESEAPPESEAPAGTGEAVPTEVLPAGSGIDVCALVTQEEAGAAIGSPVGEPVEENVPPIYSCSYDTPGFDGVSVIVVEYADAAQAEAAFQMAIDINDYEEVTGVGDRAYRSYPIFDLNVLTGRYELSVDVTDSSEEEQQYQKASELAEKALSRMP